jgi:hypothetical protein
LGRWFPLFKCCGSAWTTTLNGRKPIDLVRVRKLLQRGNRADLTPFRIIMSTAASCFFIGISLFSSIVMAIDRIPLPPVREEYFSPSGSYMFVVSTADDWKSMQSSGDLFSIDGGTRKLLWSRVLPQNYRPRFVLVGNQGEVLLLDEWMNVKSPYAVVVLDNKNHVIAQYDFDAIQKILDIPEAKIVRMAKHGWWITSPPKLNASEGIALIEAAGKIVTVRLHDGRLSLKQQ